MIYVRISGPNSNFRTNFRTTPRPALQKNRTSKATANLTSNGIQCKLALHTLMCVCVHVVIVVIKQTQ